jgi:hypothetical protein
LPWLGTAREAHEPDALPPRDETGEIERLAVVGEEDLGLDLDEAVPTRRGSGRSRWRS